LTPEAWMRIALQEAKQGDYPYGAVLVKDDQLIAKAYNTTLQDSDPSAHAEINVIRQHTQKLKSPSLAGYSLYTTGEPCPMCAAACVWAGVSEIIFAVSIQDILHAKQVQINIACDEVIAKGVVPIKITKGILRDECLKLFE
jgi:tRNA(adenine34) deaminase